MGSDRLQLLGALYGQETPCTGHTMIVKSLLTQPAGLQLSPALQSCSQQGLLSLPVGRGRSALLLGVIPCEGRGERKGEC